MRISIRPNLSMTVFVNLFVFEVSDRSKGRMSTSESRRFRDYFTRFSSSSLRAERMSFAPSEAKAFAKASPMPEEAPVIQTTLFLLLLILYKNSLIFVLILCNFKQ